MKVTSTALTREIRFSQVIGRSDRCGLDRRAAAESGSALIAVFWLIAVLSSLVVATALIVNADIEVVVTEKNAFRASQLAEMGIAIAANPNVEEWDPILRQSFFEGEEGFEARIRSEAGWLNINTMLQGDPEGSDGAQILQDLFQYWGMDLIDEAQFVINALKDWVDEDDIPVGLSEDSGGAEEEWYLEQGFENYPFNRAFYDLDEMALVRGMDIVEAYEPRWREYFTVYSEGRVDINEASADLIAAMAQLDGPDDVDELIRTRNGEDEIPDTEDDYQFTSVEEALSNVTAATDIGSIASRFSTEGSTVRIESTGFVGDYRKRLVLVIRNREAQPTILAREEAPIDP
ncbi:MAG: hypothetical protein AAGJ79_07890 [Verrucomicrobiota bacterium]